MAVIMAVIRVIALPRLATGFCFSFPLEREVYDVAGTDFSKY